MLARFGDDTLTALIWAARQRKIVVKTCVASQRNRLVPWITVFGEQCAEDEIENIDDFAGKFFAYLVSFTTGAANRIVRNSGEGRRLHSEYDSTSSMRRVAILQRRRNVIVRCSRTGTDGPARHLTTALWRPCSSMPKSLEETVMFTNEDEGFQELFDGLLACSSTKQSIKSSEIKRQNRRDDPMEVDPWRKGKRKGKKGDPPRNDDPMDVDALSRASRKRQIERKSQESERPEPHEQRQVLELRQGQKQVRKVTNMPMDGVTSKLKDGGKRQMVRQHRVQDSG